MPRRSIVIFAAIVLALAAGLGGYALMNRQLPGHLSTGTALVGGPFTLTDQNGRKVSEKDFLGRYMLVFFGFTYCPDICPTELQVMATALDRLSPAMAAKIQPLFVSIDPARDTPAAMAEYVAQFHPAIVGLTGSPAQVDAAAKAFRIYYAKAPGGDADSYMMDHTTYTYLMGPKGEFLTVFARGTTAEDMAAAVSKFVSSAR